MKKTSRYSILVLALVANALMAVTGDVMVMPLPSEPVEVYIMALESEAEMVTVMPPVNTYKMVCRGGKGMTATISNKSITGKLGGRVYLSVNLKFRKGDTANEPNAGECTWKDRGLRDSEPNRLRLQRFNWRQKYKIVDGKYRPEKGSISYLLNRLTAKRKFTVEVYNYEDRYFRVVRLNP